NYVPPTTTCGSSTCAGAGKLECVNGVPTNTCQPKTGACDDGNPCTTGETCVNGTCGGGTTTVCNDNNPCTDDTCGANGCVFTSNSNQCNDGVYCNGSDTCSGGSCSAHSANPCTGGTECNTFCNESAQT